VVNSRQAHILFVYSGALTSGEVTFQYLSDRPTADFQALGSKCIHFTWGSRGAVDVSGLGISLVTDPQSCDFILAHGTEGIGQADGSVQKCDMATFDEVMKACAELGERPMVVANPDIVTVSGYGGLIINNIFLHCLVKVAQPSQKNFEQLRIYAPR
jgi:hypothetical protein